MKCKHCGDEISKFECKVCKATIIDECQECHNEVAHGQIVVESVSVCGGGFDGKCNGIQDNDAFNPSWKSGN